MSEKTFSYYQYRQKLGYPIFIRFEEAEFEKSFVETLSVMGFDPVPREDVKNIELNPKETRILRVVKANSKIAKKINSPQFGDSRYGNEQVSTVGFYSVYCYQKVAMMIYGEGTLMWELGVKDATDLQALRTIFSRFLSFAFQGQGVVGFWGVPIEEGFVVMSPKQSNFETIFVDLNKNKILTFEGEKELDTDCNILRLSETLRDEMRPLTQEQLLSFLMFRTCYISPVGQRTSLRADIWDLVTIASGYEYPAINFQPRTAQEA